MFPAIWQKAVRSSPNKGVRVHYKNRQVIYCKLLFPSPFRAHWRHHRAVTYIQYALVHSFMEINSNKFSNKSVITNSSEVHRLDVDTLGACVHPLMSRDCADGVAISFSRRILPIHLLCQIHGDYAAKRVWLCFTLGRNGMKCNQ